MAIFRDGFSENLHRLLGDDGFFELVETFGGLRLYIPKLLENSELPEAIGEEHAKRLSRKYSGDYITVPIAREFRALRYRTEGLHNRQIAVRFAMSERGIERLSSRLNKTLRGALPPIPKVQKKQSTGCGNPKSVPKANERSLAIRAFFLSKVGSPYSQLELLAQFNEEHHGRFILSKHAVYHWCRWARLEKYSRPDRDRT